jgi:hypothetical protein
MAKNKPAQTTTQQAIVAATEQQDLPEAAAANDTEDQEDSTPAPNTARSVKFPHWEIEYKDIPKGENKKPSLRAILRNFNAEDLAQLEAASEELLIFIQDLCQDNAKKLEKGKVGSYYVEGYTGKHPNPFELGGTISAKIAVKKVRAPKDDASKEADAQDNPVVPSVAPPASNSLQALLSPDFNYKELEASVKYAIRQEDKKIAAAEKQKKKLEAILAAALAAGLD